MSNHSGLRSDLDFLVAKWYTLHNSNIFIFNIRYKLLYTNAYKSFNYTTL